MDEPEEWDLVVIGGGSAGLTAARSAAGFGARVLLIERDRLGGDCLWTGCVPSKALIAAARHSAEQDAPATGQTQQETFAAAMAGVHAAIAAVAPSDSQESLEAAGVAVRFGEARFTSERALVVDGDRIGFRQAVIATGTKPRVPRIEGADAGYIRTSGDIWQLERLPERLVILGGGPIGCEIGQAMARLGAHVTIVQRGARLLAKEDAAASALVEAALRADGVEVRTGSTAASVRSEDGVSGELTLEDGQVLPFDVLLAATGREAHATDLGFDAAGVRVDADGLIEVDAMLRTSASRIWAAGETAGLPQLTHIAGVAGNQVAINAILGLRRTFDRDRTPRVTFTAPEVASIGVLPDRADRRRHRIVEWQHEHADRAIADGDTSGYTAIVVDGRGRIVGGTIVGPRAGETMGELSLAVHAGLTTQDVAGATHPYPTYNDALWNAAIKDYRWRASQGATGAAIGVLRSLTARRRR
ncbi:dihydrolipoyl dehydrogenase family protein [Agrococcus sp. Ld7]|uniref:dihydrolipoyl dehydrogenase family protein n=1 Tax=Agrococcus sp. Ld7 TaxID=649148 RepID=UPI003864BD07